MEPVFFQNRRDITTGDAGVYVEKVTPDEIEFRVSQEGSDAAGICL